MAEGKQFVVTHIGEDGETILAHDACSEDVFPTIVNDALASDILSEHDEETRAGAVWANAELQGFGGPRTHVDIQGRVYRVEELPEDPLARDELLNARLLSSTFFKLQRRYPESRLRYVIYPNESKHPGRPHCTAASSDKSANFSLPEADRLAGDISPHEKEAKATILTHRAELLDLWYRMRPDDQKL